MITPRLAFITIVATVGYLGLAVLGWGVSPFSLILPSLPSR